MIAKAIEAKGGKFICFGENGFCELINSKRSIATPEDLDSLKIRVVGSYFLNGATGACIILTEALFFVLTMMFAPKYGMIVRRKLRKADLHVQ